MSFDRDPLLGCVLWALSFILVITGVALCAQVAMGAQFPAGYYRYGKTCAREQQQVFGLRLWSSVMLAQLEIESAWRPRARSAYASGISQFTPATERAVADRYHLAGSIWDPAYACRLQGFLMRDLAREVAPQFNGFHAQWSAVLRCYNGSPRSFWREWELCGRPDNTTAMEPCCVRRPAFCLENTRYPIKTFRAWPRYAQVWGR